MVPNKSEKQAHDYCEIDIVSRPSFLKLNENSMFATYQLMYKKRSKSCDRIHDTRVIKKLIISWASEKDLKVKSDHSSKFEKDLLKSLLDFRRVTIYTSWQIDAVTSPILRMLIVGADKKPGTNFYIRIKTHVSTN